jgi:opacity protein-like surface antigen
MQGYIVAMRHLGLNCRIKISLLPRTIAVSRAGAALAFLISGAYDFKTHRRKRARMPIFSRFLGLALILAALCPAGRMAHAQAAPVPYWGPNWPIGFRGNLTDQSSNNYGDFLNFDGSEARDGGFSHMRYNFPNGWFVGGERGGIGLSMSSFSQAGAFGNMRSLYYEGVQVGYKLQNGLPLTVYAGFDTLKYKDGIGNLFSPFDTVSGTLPGYSARAGVEFQPAPNVSLSLGFGYTQQSGGIDSDINSSSLPGASPFAVGVRR